MVIRCRGISQEPQESVLKGVTQEEVDMPLNSKKNKNPSQNNAQKSEGQKVNGSDRANQIISFILIMNSSVYVNELEQFVKQIVGVDKVKGDCNSVRLEVTGKVDPVEVKEMVERETKKRVRLILLSAETEGDKDENKDTEEKLKKQTKTVHENDIVNKKTEERVTVLKIKLCCDSCNQKLCKNLKTKGLDIVAMNVDKDLVEVKGKVDLTELRSYVKTELNKDVEIVIPTEVKVPVKKGNGTAKKKENHAGDIDKKDKDAAPINKRNKGTAVSEKYQDTGTANEKIGSIADINEKHIGSATINEQDKDKNGGIKNRKNSDNKAEMESKISNAIGSKRNGDGGGNREENGSSTIKVNPGMHYTVDDDAYGYRRGAPPRVTVLKIKLCCDSCNQKLCKNLKTKGLDIVATNVDKDLVEVKGKVDLTELRSYIKTELNKDVEIVIPTEVKVPVKKGNGTTKKKENHAGDIDKKDKDAAPINNRNQGTAVCEKHQDTGTANEKIGSIAGINEKHIGSATINEPDKDKNGDVKNRKNRDSKAEMESKTSNAIGGKRNGDGGGNREENGSSIIKLNPGMYHTVDDDAYGYWHGAPPVRYSNDPLHTFSDENPHSCSII